MNFTKMHGIGNDFVIVDCMGTDGKALAAEAHSRSKELCDRNFGIGGDGVILVLPGKSSSFRMQMFNPDGSEAEMCGNGIRCFAKYVFDRHLAEKVTDLPVETGAGLLHVVPSFGADGMVNVVTVDMGEPVLTPSAIPTTLGQTSAVNVPLDLGDRELSVTAVSMGNPHAVIFVDDTVAFPVADVGPCVESHAAFPKRTNTEFIQVISRQEINFRVWERGAAETLACGTGACAAVVACVLNAKTERNVLVHLPGGDLTIEWRQHDNHVYMTGPATEVFSGTI